MGRVFDREYHQRLLFLWKSITSMGAIVGEERNRLDKHIQFTVCLVSWALRGGENEKI
jgi:hypothetical protein